MWGTLTGLRPKGDCYARRRHAARNNPYRYAICIREAMRRQIKAEDLVGWLEENGWLNTLYRGRPLVATRLTIKTLHLNDALTVPNFGAFTVTLERDHRGYFNVLGTPLVGGETVVSGTVEKVRVITEGLQL